MSNQRPGTPIPGSETIEGRRKPAAEATGHDPAKRAQILEGAWRVFSQTGLAGASVDRLANEAGVSKPTLYKYFESKEAIFLTLMNEQAETVRGTRFRLHASMGPPATLLRELGIGFVSALMQQRTLDTFRLVIAETPRYPALGRAFEKVGPQRSHDALATYLQELDALGVLRIDDAALASRQFIALCECGLLRRAHTRNERPSRARIASIVDAAVRVFLKGYAT